MSKSQILIWDWTAKNISFSHRVSAVRAYSIGVHYFLELSNQLVFINRVNGTLCNDNMGHFQIAVLVTRPPLIH